MKLTHKSLAIASALTLAFAITILTWNYYQTAFGNVTDTSFNISQATEDYRFFSTSTDQVIFSTSTTANSSAINAWYDANGRKDAGYFVVEGAEKVNFVFQREGKFGNAGSSVFDVDISYDGSTWYDFPQLYPIGATTTPTHFGSATLSGTSSAAYAADLRFFAPYAIRCNVTETTDGEHFCKAVATY